MTKQEQIEAFRIRMLGISETGITVDMFICGIEEGAVEYDPKTDILTVTREGITEKLKVGVDLWTE